MQGHWKQTAVTGKMGSTEFLDTEPIPTDAAEFQKMTNSDGETCGKTIPLQLLVFHR